MSELEHLSVTDESMDDREQIIDQLMHEYSNAILHLIYTYVKNRATAEDLTQEIFIKCYEKLGQFNQRASIKTWVYRIAYNHCKDYLRSWHYRKVTTHAVMALPIKYREVVFLHYYEELSLAEISKVTT